MISARLSYRDAPKLERHVRARRLGPSGSGNSARSARNVQIFASTAIINLFKILIKYNFRKFFKFNILVI